MRTSIFSSPKWLTVLLAIYGLEYIVALFLSAPPERNSEPAETPRRLTLIPSATEDLRLRPSEANDAAFPPWLRPESLDRGGYTWTTTSPPIPTLAPGRQFLPENASVDGFSDLLTQRPDLPELDEPPDRVFRLRPKIVLRGALKAWRVASELPPLNESGLPQATAPTSVEISLNGPGQPLSVTRLKSCGVPKLDQHAINVLQNSQFTPTKPASESQPNEWVIGRVDILWGPQP